MYQGQTPQSFKAKKLKELYEGLTEEEKEILTDACKIFVIKGQDVHLVEKFLISRSLIHMTCELLKL